jgi:hypothetical protein
MRQYGGSVSDYNGTNRDDADLHKEVIDALNPRRLESLYANVKTLANVREDLKELRTGFTMILGAFGGAAMRITDPLK